MLPRTLCPDCHSCCIVAAASILFKYDHCRGDALASLLTVRAAVLPVLTELSDDAGSVLQACRAGIPVPPCPLCQVSVLLRARVIC
jgi:hypothetical protein